MDRLTKKERQELILKRLGSDVAVQIAPLAAELDVTTETIRRDLDELASRGLISRTYGGAALLALAAEPGVAVRATSFVEERARIGKAAAAIVKTGDVVMIDAGSTTTHLAHALARAARACTVLTNSFGAARILSSAEEISVVMCPGRLRPTEDGVYGHETTDFLERFHADHAFIGCGGFSARELTDADPNAVWVKRRMMARSKRTVLLADASKAGLELYASVCGWAEINALISDAPPPEEIRAALAAAGTEFIPA